MSSPTRVTRLIAAPRATVYHALLDAQAVAKWRVPDGMTCEIHEWNTRVGGSLRVSLTYVDESQPGKSASHTDSYRGWFTELVTDERVVEVDEFETDDPAMRGQMTSTITLTDANGGTEVVAVHEGLPSAVSTSDNETGWRMALRKLAALVENR